MEKLEEYKAKAAEQEGRIDFHEGNCEMSFKNGFDAAIALGLPVKFAKFLKDVLYVDPFDLKIRVHPDKVPSRIRGKTEDLYQYWIHDIYKPE